MPRCSAALSNPLHSLLSFHRRCKDTIVLTVLQPHQVSIMRHSVAFISHSPRITLLLCYSLSLPPVTVNHTETRFFVFVFLFFPASSLQHSRAHCCLLLWLQMYTVYGHQSMENGAFRNIQKINNKKPDRCTVFVKINY